MPLPEGWQRARTAGDTVADWAASGVIPLTGRPDEPPLLPPGHAASTARRLTDLIAEATAGRVLIDGAQLLSERAAYRESHRRGDIAVGGACRLLATSDGWAAVSCPRPDDALLLGAVVGQKLGADPWPAVTAWIAEHRGQELADRAELVGVAAAPVETGTAPRPVPTPLEARDMTGRLVVDFSALWAGPLCAHLLGLAGARVVKVETPSRPDGARAGDPEFYRLLHGGHRSVVLDPSTPGGRAAMAALVRSADIVIEASRPRALAGFGLDAEAAVADGTVWVSITAAGRASGRVGFGDDVAASAGLVAWTAERTPVFVGDAVADPLTGLTAAVLAMTGPGDGSGVLWDVAMADVVAATLDAQETRVPSRAARPGPDGGWLVESGSSLVQSATPRRRDGTRPASPYGADTSDVLARLGLP